MSEMDISKVLELLPHRYPFVLIDKVLEHDPEGYLVALKNVTINEPFFAGHFPGNPVMPGVLILEALAQASVIHAYARTGTTPKDGSLYFFAGIDKARFKQVVRPGDQLRLEVQLIKEKRDIMVCKGVATVDGKLVASAELMSAKMRGES